ncbi:MAG: alpha amylase C-terminal domain-containing protein [Phycisphaeraceae bacterium]|nr:alpha amylase C-terminal domain-containing protein [Phycisphaeraceae bacterium]
MLATCRSTQFLFLAAAIGWSDIAVAQLDNNVQWQGVSHTGWNDRRPRVPRSGESFAIRFQTFRSDVSSARARIDDGSVHYANASIIGSRGPYDLWEAAIPSTVSSTLNYVLEITDGSDTDFYSAKGMTENLDLSQPFTLNFSTLEHAPLGSTPVGGGTVFKVWSPASTSCVVRGTFNSWGSSPLTKVGESFIGFVAGAAPGGQYKYFFNNSVWNSDPRSAALVPTGGYNSVIVDADAYTWQVNDFSPAPMDQLVIYQLHVGTFAGRNDPKGSTPNPSRYIDVAARADHLAELGVNAVMLNPVNEFPGDFSGGYNTVSPFAIESKLGTPDQFRQMVDALHARGIAVILDIVYNHAASSDNILWNFGGTQQYFDAPAVETPWGAQCDYDKAAVRQYYIDAAETMLTDYRLDGFRMDATMYMTDSGLTPQWSNGQKIIRAMHDNKNNRHADKHTIAEIYIDNRWVTDPTSTGLGFTAQYQNEFKEAVRAAIFTAGSGPPNMGRVANALDGQGVGVSGRGVLNYFELHDDCWPLNGTKRAVTSIDTTSPADDQFARGRTKIGQAFNLLSRGVPALVQGTEWLEDEGWESARLDWSHKTRYPGIFKFYSDLIALRTSEPPLFADSPLSVFHVNEWLDVMAWERRIDGSGSFVAVVNLSDTERSGYRIGIPREGRWTVTMNSNDTQYGGPGGGPAGVVAVENIAADGFPRSMLLDLPARTMVLLRHIACPADFNGDQLVDDADFVVFLTAYNSLDCADPGMASGCPADFNGDNLVDDSDFVLFVAAYNELLCS